MSYEHGATTAAVIFQRLRMAGQMHSKVQFMRIELPHREFVCVRFICPRATLEKLSIDDMSQKSTLFVRGRIAGCAGDQRGSVIYTRCRVSVTERWKGYRRGSGRLPGSGRNGARI